MKTSDKSSRGRTRDHVPGKVLLSIDVEEYFHVEAAAGRLGRRRWDALALRCARHVDRLLELLDRRGCSATFFCLGWVARRLPDTIRRIAEAGHPLASHGMTHHMLGRLSPQQFRDELLDSRRLLEDLGGRPVIGFRAPTFSVTHRTAWAIDVLAECGYRYDSSVFPVRHDRYGVPEAPTDVHHAEGPTGGQLIELPPMTVRWMNRNWPIGGGGYLRLFPVRLMGEVIRRRVDAGVTSMIYLHPWEIDPGQPHIPMSFPSRLRHRLGLSKTFWKLRWLLDRFDFTSVEACLDHLSARATDRFRYGVGRVVAPTIEATGGTEPGSIRA